MGMGGKIHENGAFSPTHPHEGGHGGFGFASAAGYHEMDFVIHEDVAGNVYGQFARSCARVPVRPCARVAAYQCVRTPMCVL